jgi:hypothetical protein
MKAQAQFAVVQFKGCIGYGEFELSKEELREIGDFTRENILKWADTAEHDITWVEIQTLRDFRAVYGDLEIPWATEEAKQEWDAAKKARTLTAEEKQKMGYL